MLKRLLILAMVSVLSLLLMGSHTCNDNRENAARLTLTISERELTTYLASLDSDSLQSYLTDEVGVVVDISFAADISTTHYISGFRIQTVNGTVTILPAEEMRSVIGYKYGSGISSGSIVDIGDLVAFPPLGERSHPNSDEDWTIPLTVNSPPIVRLDDDIRAFKDKVNLIYYYSQEVHDAHEQYLIELKEDKDEVIEEKVEKPKPTPTPQELQRSAEHRDQIYGWVTIGLVCLIALVGTWFFIGLFTVITAWLFGYKKG